MRFRQYAYSLLAAAGIALSSPAEAQDAQEECEHIVSPLPPNPYDQIPPNPYCDEEDHPRLDDGLDFTLRDPNENFPHWQRSAGTTYHRLEIPNALHLDILDLNIEFSTFSIGTGDDERLWRGNDLQEYVRLFDEDDITFHDGEFGFNLQYLREAARRDIPVIAEQMPDVLGDFWNDVREAIRPSETDIAVEFAGFFRRILPRYTSDGVITPEEAVEIADLVEEHYEDVYDRELSDEEKQNLDSAIERFRTRTNDLLSRLDIDNLVSRIMEDPNNHVFIGEHTFGEYRLLFEDMLSLLHIEYGENSMRAWADAYTSLRARSDSMSMYYFSTTRGDYIMRHGSLNEVDLLTEGHLRLNAEFHTGRPLRDFADDTNEDVLNSLDQIELLLGYQPVMIDARMDAHVWADVSLENLIQDTYDLTIIRDRRRIGLGISHGFVYRFDLDFDVWASAWVNSFDYEMGLDVRADMSLREEEGRQVRMWHFVEDRGYAGFFGASLGAVWENLAVRDRSLRMAFSLRSDFEGNMTRSLENGQHDELRMEQRLVPVFAGVAGVYLGQFALFATVRDATLGAGIFATSDRGTIEARIDTGGHVRFAHLLVLDGRVDDDHARALHRDRLLHEYSLFPARHAAVWDLENQYRSSALHGLFLESGIDASFLGDPHEAPLVGRLGIMFAGDGYVRLGGFSGADLSVYGAYAAAGGRAFGASIRLVQERITQRDSTATSIVVQSRLALDNFHLHFTGAGTMVTPAIARYLNYGEGKFGYTYQILFETVLW